MGLFSKKELTPAQTVMQEVCGVKKGERVLIIANPETANIAQELFTAAQEADARPTLIFQQKKDSSDYAEPAVIAAIASEPNLVLSISAGKLGRDEKAIEKPYTDKNGAVYDNIFDYLLSGKKCIRAVWTPGITKDMFSRTVSIDYKKLAERCEKIKKHYEGAVSVHVTSPNGTDVTVPVAGRMALVDNGDFSTPGQGGNIPSGEVFISPVVKGDTKTVGTIVFDGSMTFSDGDALLETPITVTVKEGFVSDISGGEEAKRLLKDIQAAEKESLALEMQGKLPRGMGSVYSQNARNIGELGIGLNPAASITGNMLEDEKAFRTCHFAIGQNYDGDAPALIHFDGVVRNPTLVISYANKPDFVLLKNGELTI